MKFFLLILKNLRRNKLRTTLTALATMVLVFVVTMIWTVVYFLEAFTEQKSGNLKAVVTERWQMSSQMPLWYVEPLSHGAARKAGDKEPKDSMAWQFYIGTLDAVKKTRENMVVLVAMDVRKLPRKSADGKTILAKGMIDDLDPIDEGLVEKLAQTTLPGGRWDENGFMNERYLNNAIDAYKGPFGTKHPLDQRRLNMFWVEVAQKEDFGQVVEQINTSPSFAERPVKCETFASLIANFLDSYSGFIWFIQWVLVPGSMFSMILLIANAISLNVRERIKEMAVLKVMGFQPWQLLVLVLGEALLLGASSGLLAGGLIYFIANSLAGGIKLPDSEPFPVPWMAFVWGASVGGATALIGSILPAWTARTVKASEVFAREG